MTKSKTGTKFKSRKLHAVSIQVSTSSSTLIEEHNSEVVLEGDTVGVSHRLPHITVTMKVSTHEVMSTVLE